MNVEATELWGRAQRALLTAERLATEDPDASASRAYYAAYYAVSALFTSQGRAFRKHTAVAAAVHRDLVKTGQWPKEDGATYSWLATLRFTGDYGGEAHVSPEQAQKAVSAAGRVLQAVRQTLPGAFPDETP